MARGATSDLDTLRGFLRASRGKSQEEIIVEFLFATVIANPVADHGSVLVNHVREKKLILFNESDVLFKKHLLDPKSRALWPTEFTYFEGIAGRCIREESTQVYPPRRGQAAPDDFIGNSPIKNMVCFPILTGSEKPFGVVCFHNNDSERPFDEAAIQLLESYVDVLAVALHAPYPELLLEKNVFIVHGRDDVAREQLENVLLRNKVNPRVLVREDKGPRSILEEVEQLLRVCKAGFILATPDDEGRLRGSGDELVPRARENVIFETGLLFAKYREFERVSLLLQRPLQLPSDLAGIAYEQFSSIRDIEPIIVNKLVRWGLKAA